MKFVYNGNLLEDERIEKVSKEIREAYPFVTFEEAKEVAMLEEPISKTKDFAMEFKRLYNLLLILQDKGKANLVCKDLFTLVKNVDLDKESKYSNIVEEVYRFLMGERDFPYLEEFEEYS